MRHKINHPGARREAGFSILELMIAMIIFAIVMGAVYGLLKVAGSDRFTTNQRTEILQNLRVAMNAIGRDALNAGYNYNKNGGNLPDNALNTLFNLPADTLTTPDVLLGVISGRGVNQNNISPEPLAANKVTDQVTFVYKYDFAAPLEISAVSANQLTVAAGKNNSNVKVNEIYLIEGANSQAIGMVTSLTGTDKINFSGAPAADTLGINKTDVTGNVIRFVTANATITKIRIVTFRVLVDGTLVRTEYGNDVGGTQQDQPLAYGVERMNITYVLADGTVTTDPAAGADNITGNGDDTPAKLADVRQVRVSITARSSDIDQRLRDYFRVTLPATFNTRNMGYSSET